MNQAIYEELKRVARKGEITQYAKIAPMANLDMGQPEDRAWMSEILGDIARHEHEQGRPLLSVVVVHSEDNSPGVGSFTLAKELKVMRGNDQLMFFAQELRRTHDYWKNA